MNRDYLPRLMDYGQEGSPFEFIPSAALRSAVSAFTALTWFVASLAVACSSVIAAVNSVPASASCCLMAACCVRIRLARNEAPVRFFLIGSALTAGGTRSTTGNCPVAVSSAWSLMKEYLCGTYSSGGDDLTGLTCGFGRDRNP